MKLMIIDDHAGVRSLIRELVATASDAVYECTSGNEAVRVARFFKPDYVTMDVRLPGLDGFATTQAICALQPAARVVMVTSFDQPEFRRCAAEAGAIGDVVKENLSELRAALLDPRASIGRRDRRAGGRQAPNREENGSP